MSNRKSVCAVCFLCFGWLWRQSIRLRIFPAALILVLCQFSALTALSALSFSLISSADCIHLSTAITTCFGHTPTLHISFCSRSFSHFIFTIYIRPLCVRTFCGFFLPPSLLCSRSAVLTPPPRVSLCCFGAAALAVRVPRVFCDHSRE